jgi:hypothetical protein
LSCGTAAGAGAADACAHSESAHSAAAIKFLFITVNPFAALVGFSGSPRAILLHLRAGRKAKR